jgi:hypothetical protein
MARLTAETLKTLAQELYEYELADEAATSVARIVGAGAAGFRRLDSPSLQDLQPPFGYPTLIAEAHRQLRRK